MSRVLAVAAAPTGDAVAHFAARLSYETDVSDVHADLTAGTPGIVVVDSRSGDAWRQGHLPGALHLPAAEVQSSASCLVPSGSTVVTYCWGPGCNGATRAALLFARLGYPVKEMIGGFEYWVREGLPVVTATGPYQRPVDDLTAVRAADGCGC